jgi:hypothetical protein
VKNSIKDCSERKIKIKIPLEKKIYSAVNKENLKIYFAVNSKNSEGELKKLKNCRF